MVYLGPALLLLTLLRAFTLKSKDRILKIAFGLSCIFLIVSIGIAARSILNPHSSGNLSGAIDFVPMVKKGQFIFLMLFVTLVAIGYGLRNARFNYFLIILSTCAAFVFTLNTDWWLSPEQHYRFRSISGLLFFALLLISGLYFFIFKSHSNTINKSVNLVSTVIFFSLYIPFISYDIGYYKWSKIFEFEALNLSQSTHIEKTRIYEHENSKWDSGFNWSWSNPTLSILLRGKSDVLILNHSTYSGWEPNLKNLGKSPLDQYHRSSGLYGNKL